MCEVEVLIKMQITTLPRKSGSYLVRMFSSKDSQYKNRSVFYDATKQQFRLANGRKNDKIVCWYLPVAIEENLISKYLK